MNTTKDAGGCGGVKVLLALWRVCVGLEGVWELRACCVTGRRPVGAGDGSELLVGLVATGSWRVSSGRVALEQEILIRDTLTQRCIAIFFLATFLQRNSSTGTD